MKPTIIIIITLSVVISTVNGQPLHNILAAKTGDYQVTVSQANKKQKLNFFVISKIKKGKLDMATRFNVLRTKVQGFFRRKRLTSIVARDANHAARKIRKRLIQQVGRIGTIWFDSHGMYKKGYSLFQIGKDEFSYKTLKDSSHDDALEQLAGYADDETNVVIGSCYGGATYHRVSIDYKDSTRMNGDSLMISLGKIFNQANIYASESWVMTKPGLFRKKAAVAGFPGRKLFRDICYKPAWENVSKWNRYDARNKSFTKVNPVMLNHNGSLVLSNRSFLSKKAAGKDIAKNLSRLEPGLYK